MIHDLIDLKSGINIVYGQAATGKTTLALMLARDYSKFSKVIFIDTENGFNFDRFKQISQENYESCLKNILLFKVNNFTDQNKIIRSLLDIEKINLIIIDTIGMHYRLELKNDAKYANNKINETFQILKMLNKRDINVFLTNQVYNNFETNKLELIGGNMIRNLCDCIIRLDNNPRKMTKEKPTNNENLFEIKDEGICLK